MYRSMYKSKIRLVFRLPPRVRVSGENVTSRKFCVSLFRTKMFKIPGEICSQRNLKLDVHIARKLPQDPLLDSSMYRHLFIVPLVAMVMGKFRPAVGVQAVVLSMPMQMVTSMIRPMQVSHMVISASTISPMQVLQMVTSLSSMIPTISPMQMVIYLSSTIPTSAAMLMQVSQMVVPSNNNSLVPNRFHKVPSRFHRVPSRYHRRRLVPNRFHKVPSR